MPLGAWKIYGMSSVARLTGVRVSVAAALDAAGGKRVPYAALAPELALPEGEAQVGTPVDLWSAGLLLARLLKGTEPSFTQPTELPLPTELRGGSDLCGGMLCDAVALCLETQPQNRPTAEELAAYLSNGTTEQSGDFADLRLHVQVRRDAKGLGVGVTSSNVIQSLSAGHVLQVGDQILGVDGERLAGRHLSQVLASSQAVYDFEVMRSDHVVGMTLRKVPPDHPILRPRARIDLLRVDLVRDSAGLGLDLSPSNVVRDISRGGASERTGLLQPGDVIIAVDDEPLGAKSVAEAHISHGPETSLTILRAEPLRVSSISLAPPPFLRLHLESDASSTARSSPAPELDPPPATLPTSTATAAREPATTPAPTLGPTRALPPIVILPTAPRGAGSAGGGPDLPGGGTGPTDSELLDFFLELQGFDRISILSMYQSNKASAKAALCAAEAEAESRRSELGLPPLAGRATEAPTLSPPRSSNGGVGGGGGASESGSLPKSGGLSHLLRLPVDNDFEPAPLEEQEGEAAAAEAEAGEEPLALRIQRLLAQSSDQLESPATELTSGEAEAAAGATGTPVLANAVAATGSLSTDASEQRF